MKKETMRILALTIISLFAISFLIGAVSAQETIGDKITKALSGTGGMTDSTKATISKLLLMTLVAMLVYSISSFIPFIEGETVKWGVSIIVAILSFIFVSAQNIRYITSTYEGLGIALTSIFPLIILVVFTFKFREANWEKKDAFTAAMSGIIIKAVLILFFGYVIIRWAMITWTATQVSELTFLYPATALGILIWFLIEKKVWKRTHKEKIGVESERAEEVTSAATRQTSRLAKQEKEEGAPL